MKNVYCISNKQHGGIKSGVLQSKNSPFRKRCMLVHCLAEGAKVKLSSQVYENDRFGRFCGYNDKTSIIVIDEPEKVRHRRRAAIR